MATSTVENYLKQLLLEQQAQQADRIAMGRLAETMGVVPGTATSMVKALSDSGLVEYEPRAGVRLTHSGEQLALHVLRRHRLVELFLVEVLHLDWSDVHEEAEMLEHAISERVLDRIDAILGHPTVDPHGDPIPNCKGQIHEPRRISLADCPTGLPHRVARILDQDPAFLKFVNQKGLRPGATVTVQSREPAAEAVMVQLGKHTLSLGTTAANKILVVAEQEPSTQGKKSAKK